MSLFIQGHSFVAESLEKASIKKNFIQTSQSHVRASNEIKNKRPAGTFLQEIFFPEDLQLRSFSYQLTAQRNLSFNCLVSTGLFSNLQARAPPSDILT